MILKKGSATPHDEIMIMLRMIAIGNLLQMSVTYLKKNCVALKSAMNKNPNRFEEEIIERHKHKMNRILEGMHPTDNTEDEAEENIDSTEEKHFKHSEKWLGHDLLVNAIAIDGKTGGKGPMRFRVFEDSIVQKEWKDFEAIEKINSRPEPDRYAKYPPDAKGSKKKKKRKTRGRKQKTRGNKKRGKCYCRNQIPLKAVRLKLTQCSSIQL